MASGKDENLRYNRQRQSLLSSEESHPFPYQGNRRHSEPLSKETIERIIFEGVLEQRNPHSRSLHNSPSNISLMMLPSISPSANTSGSSLPSVSSSGRASVFSFEVLPTLSEEGKLYHYMCMTVAIIV